MKRTVLFCAVAGCVLLADLGSLRGLPEGRWTHPPDAEPATQAYTDAPAPVLLPDSTLQRVPAGETLIATLPARVDGRPVQRYEMLRTPALSNLAGRSFFWRTRTQDRGRHRLLFRARHDTTAVPASADTLTLRVSVE